MDTHLKCRIEVLQMSTHNVDFLEEVRKISVLFNSFCAKVQTTFVVCFFFLKTNYPLKRSL